MKLTDVLVVSEQGFSMKAKYSKVMLWWKGYYLNK